MQVQGRRKTLVGEVVSNKMVKTVSVRVDRLTKHPQFKRYVRRSWHMTRTASANQATV